MKFTPRHPSLLFKDIGRDYFAQLLTACVGGEATFKSKYLPVAEKLALTVQDLPLEKTHFAYPGGALQFGLLSGLTALRLADGVIFEPSATAQKRMIVEPQYRYAAWCAALAGVPLIVHHHAQLTLNDQPWSFASSPANIWEACKETGSYGIEWKATTPNPPSAALGIVLLGSFFYPGQFGDFDPAVLASFNQAINPGLIQPPAEAALSKVVRVAQEKVKAAEKLRLSRVFAPGSTPENAFDGVLESLKQPAMQSTGADVASSIVPQTPLSSASPEEKIPQNVASWVRALIADPVMSQQFKFLAALEMVDVSMDQLKFGSSAKAMFDLLTAANLVHSKITGQTVRLTPVLATFIKNEFIKQGITHA